MLTQINPVSEMRAAVRQIAQVSRSRVVAPRLFASAQHSLRALHTCVTLQTAKTYNFQAETKQLLNIVTNALYTDKHVFLRELISNASDALEKARHLQSVGKTLVAPSEQFQISLSIRKGDDKTPTVLVLQDSGVGMTAQEMIDHLGTIAKSGSKAFVAALKNNEVKASPSAEGDAATTPTDAASNIIGQFGVGFYSAFMVADKVGAHDASFT